MQLQSVLNTVLKTGAIAMAATIALPVHAQPVPPVATNACTQRVAEEMVVATRDIEVTSAGPVDAENGVRTLFMRNRTTGQTAQCRVNTIDGTVLSVTLTSQPDRPAQNVPQASINACTQRVAEEMVVATRDIEVTSAGPVDAENGVRTLFMRNRTTGQTAQCRVNTIDGTVLSVTLTSQPDRPAQNVPQASINACIQRTAEEMVVQARNIEMTSAGPVNAENGVRTLSMRDRTTSNTADCRVNTITHTVLSVTLTSTPPNSSSGRPVAPNYGPARNCQAIVNSDIRRTFARVQKLNFSTDTTRAYFISNAQEGIRGEGQFYQQSGRWHRFSYNCVVNLQNGRVVSSSHRLLP